MDASDGRRGPGPLATRAGLTTGADGGYRRGQAARGVAPSSQSRTDATEAPGGGGGTVRATHGPGRVDPARDPGDDHPAHRVLSRHLTATSGPDPMTAAMQTRAWGPGLPRPPPTPVDGRRGTRGWHRARPSCTARRRACCRRRPGTRARVGESFRPNGGFQVHSAKKPTRSRRRR